jgi:hypothetical protein
VFVFFVASVVATPQSLPSSLFVFFFFKKKKIMLREWHQVSSLLACVLFLFYVFL